MLPAIADTVPRFDLDRGDLDAFLTSMRMDLEVTAYDDYDDLLVYMDGSAAVIGTLMLPILLAGDPEPRAHRSRSPRGNRRASSASRSS